MDKPIHTLKEWHRVLTPQQDCEVVQCILRDWGREQLILQEQAEAAKIYEDTCDELTTALGRWGWEHCDSASGVIEMVDQLQKQVADLQAVMNRLADLKKLSKKYKPLYLSEEIITDEMHLRIELAAKHTTTTPEGK